MKKKISIILPVYNEEKYIADCIISLQFQSLKPSEIIIVDDGSTDNSLELISRFTDDGSRITLLKQNHAGPAKARNLGASKAGGEILVFLDADIIYNNEFLKEITKPILEGKEIATFTRSEYVGNLDNRWAKFWDDVTFANKGQRVKKGQGSRERAFRAIAARSFKKVGGYDSYGASDDASVLKKLGKTAKAVDTAICYHNNPSTLSEVFSSARWMGRDAKNKKNMKGLLVFSPPWSLLKSVVGSLRRKNFYFLPFRLTFDGGLFLGILENNLGRSHFK